jgi:hypothetical protein
MLCDVLVNASGGLRAGGPAPVLVQVTSASMSLTRMRLNGKRMVLRRAG